MSGGKVMVPRLDTGILVMQQCCNAALRVSSWQRVLLKAGKSKESPRCGLLRHVGQWESGDMSRAVRNGPPRPGEKGEKDCGTAG
jgi:hypothetical protein